MCIRDRHIYLNRKAIKTVLGNHDLHFLAVYYGVRKLNKFDTLSDLLNYQSINDLAKWLTKQPLVREIKIGKREFIMVHAGFPKSATKESLKKVNGKIKKALKNNPKKTLKVIFDHKRKAPKILKDKKRTNSKMCWLFVIFK